MKRILAVAVVCIVALMATNAFAFGVSVPKSVGDVERTMKNAGYDQCKGWADTHKNREDVNSSNIRSKMTGKEFSNIVTERNWENPNASNYERENRKLKLRANYLDAKVTADCDNRKCYISCSK